MYENARVIPGTSLGFLTKAPFFTLVRGSDHLHTGRPYRNAQTDGKRSSVIGPFERMI